MIENCGVCEHLVSEMMLGCPVYGCGYPALKQSERFVVPQHSSRDPDTGERTATFHRVPMSCPRPADVVNKRPDPTTDHDGQEADR